MLVVKKDYYPLQHILDHTITHPKLIILLVQALEFLLHSSKQRLAEMEKTEPMLDEIVVVEENLPESL